MARTLLDQRLGSLLIEAGILTQEQLESAWGYQDELGGALGKILVKLGHVSERDLAGALARLENIAYTDLSNLKLSPSLMNLLPRELMEERLALPIKLDHNILTVVMADPTNLEVVELLRFDTGYDIMPMLALGTDIREKLNHFYYSGKTPSEGGKQYGLPDLVNEIRPIRRKTVPFDPEPLEGSVEQKFDVLRTLLTQKGLITEHEFASLLKEQLTKE